MSNIVNSKYYKDFMALPEVGWPTIVSAILHIGVFCMAVFGLPQIASNNDPYIHPDEIVMDIELFSAGDVIDESKPKSEGGEVPPPPSKPVYNNTDSVPVLATPEDKPEIKKPDPTLIKVPPKPVSKPVPPPKQKQPEPEPEKPEIEVEASPLQEPEIQPTPDRNITSLLKDLTPSDWENAEKQINSDDDNESSGKTSLFGNSSQQMTSSDLVALNQGVQQCWNVNAGGRYAENLVVRLRVLVNPDRSVQDVIILDQIRYATDPHFKSAADAARWALLSPECSTLNLPPEKYETWKSFIYVFDPSQML